MQISRNNFIYLWREFSKFVMYALTLVFALLICLFLAYETVNIALEIILGKSFKNILLMTPFVLLVSTLVKAMLQKKTKN